MKLKAVKIIFTVLIASVLSTGIIALPVQNTFAEDSVQIENSVTESSDIAVPYMNPVGQNKGTWIKESNGRWWYKHKDGSYTKYNWEYIDGSWYFFDKNGWMWTEWLQWEGNWYYLNPSGVMHTGWLKDNGKWYYFTMRGIMVTRWVKIDGVWYYFNGNDGHMNTDPFTYDRRTYEFYSSGALKITKILVNEQTQEESNWCWAASSAMVGTYRTISTITQRGIVQHVHGNLRNEGGNTQDEIDAINFASLGTKESSHMTIGNASFSTMVDYIDNNKPFLIRLSLTSGGHAVVGAGYNKSTKEIWIIDPAQPQVSSFFCPYSTLEDGGRYRSTWASCRGIIVY
ncbi:MAG: C39 family peptidase [Eubacterium sp.]|nr:C39 family peptidase [Eubacterium sp.]